MTYPFDEDRVCLSALCGNGSGRPRRGCRERNRSRAVAVCISWFEAHVRSLQAAAASCQIPLSIAKAARQKALPTTLTSTQWQEQAGTV